MTTGRGKAAVALASGGLGAALGAAVTAILAARPAAAAPENEKMDYLINLQTIMVQQLQRLIEIGEGLTMPEIVLPPEVTLKSPQAIIVVPPDPEMLCNAAMIKAELGRMTVPTWRATLACPAGATRTLPFNIPLGWVAYRRRPLEISSDFYDPNVGLNVYSDGTLINPVAPMPITGAFTIDMGEYVIQWTQLLVEVINGTATDAVLSFQVCTYLMDNSYWEGFVHPLIDAVRIKVEELLE